MLKSPLYNTDGYLRYTDTRMRGFHLALSGSINGNIDYRAMVSYRKSWGDPFIPSLSTAHTTSFMVEAVGSHPSLPNWNIKAQIAADRGNLYGNTWGVGMSVTYKGSFNINRK